MVRLILGFVSAAMWLPVYLYFTTGAERQWTFVLTCAFTVPLTAFVAAPAFYFVRRHVDLLLCTAFGAFIGALCSIMFVNTFADMQSAVDKILMFMAIGLFSSLLFWAIGVWGNRCLIFNSTATRDGGCQ